MLRVYDAGHGWEVVRLVGSLGRPAFHNFPPWSSNVASGERRDFLVIELRAAPGSLGQGP